MDGKYNKESLSSLLGKQTNEGGGKARPWGGTPASTCRREDNQHLAHTAVTTASGGIIKGLNKSGQKPDEKQELYTVSKSPLQETD